MFLEWAAVGAILAAGAVLIGFPFRSHCRLRVAGCHLACAPDSLSDRARTTARKLDGAAAALARVDILPPVTGGLFMLS